MNDALERSISRVVDRCDTPKDWQILSIAIDESPGVQGEIIDSLRHDANLRQEVNLIATLASTVDLPAPPRPASRQPSGRPTAWRAAALLAGACVLGLIGGFFLRGAPGPSPLDPSDENSATVIRESREAYDEFLRLARGEGRQIDVLPDLVLDVRPQEQSQQVEVFTLKRVVERRLVDEIIRAALDDSGKVVALPVAREDLEKPQTF